MKDLTKIDINNFQKEDKLHIDMTVNNFDITVNNISTKDEITAKIILYIEREIRNSYEYKSYIQYLLLKGNNSHQVSVNKNTRNRTWKNYLPKQKALSGEPTCLYLPHYQF